MSTGKALDNCTPLIGFAAPSLATAGHVSAPVEQGFNLASILEYFCSQVSQLAPTQQFMTIIQFAGQLITERDKRPSYLDIEFREADWDMLLDLFYRSEQGLKTSISSLTLGSRVPATTALRYLAMLKSKAMIETEADPCDRRRVYATLTAATRSAILAYLTDIASARNIGLLPRLFI